MHAEHVDPTTGDRKNEIDPVAQEDGERIGQEDLPRPNLIGLVQKGSELRINTPIGKHDHKVAITVSTAAGGLLKSIAK